MTTRKNGAAAAMPKADIVDRPIDVINDRLAQAHATLDLLVTLTSHPKDALRFIEEMCDGTLHNALHGAMLRISEAMEAADRIGVNHGS